MGVSGRCAVVTGGSRGIGRVICLELAAQGANIVLCYAGSEEKARETVLACEQLGVRALAVRCDVRDAQDVQAMIGAAQEALGRIDILVNNAGVTRDALLITMKEEDFDAVLDTNLKGIFHVTKAVSKLMMKKRAGRIVNMASVVGIMGNAGQTNYAAAKAGVIGFTKSAAREFAARGITVNAVAPGFIATDMTAAMPEKAKEATLAAIPLRRMGEPEDVANAVAFLVSDQASYITGQVVKVDGGMVM